MIRIYVDGGQIDDHMYVAGAAVYEDERLIDKVGSVVITAEDGGGLATNNKAEYDALLHALNWLNDHKSTYQGRSVHIFTDSQLVYMQLQDAWKVNVEHLKNRYLLAKARLLVLESSNIEVFMHWVPRALNTRAHQICEDLKKEIGDKKHDAA